MGKMALKRRIGWIFGVGVALGLAGACSLNPQPIPPGDQTESDASPTNARNPDASGTPGGGGNGDGGDGSFAGLDGGDAGENLDAGDAGDEDASDSGDE